MKYVLGLILLANFILECYSACRELITDTGAYINNKVQSEISFTYHVTV